MGRHRLRRCHVSAVSKRRMRDCASSRQRRNAGGVTSPSPRDDCHPSGSQNQDARNPARAQYGQHHAFDACIRHCGGRADAPPQFLSKAWGRTRSAMKLPPVSFHAFRHHAPELTCSPLAVALGTPKPASGWMSTVMCLRVETRQLRKLSPGYFERRENDDIAPPVASGLQFLFCCSPSGN